MTRRHTLAELVLGIEGLALLRGLIAGTDDEAAARLDDVRRGGRVIVTDIHPAMVHLGGQAAHIDADGARAFVRAHPHLHSDYLTAFRAAGLEVDELIEPPPNRAWFKMQKGAWSNAPGAFVRAFDGIPAAIV